MCRSEDVTLRKPVFFMAFVAWLMTVAGVVLLLLTFVGCMTIQDCTIKVDNKSGSVSIGNKDVQVPATVNIPIQ